MYRIDRYYPGSSGRRNATFELNIDTRQGLRLVVSNRGAKKWVLRFTIDGKHREMGLGSFPDVGLAELRDKATEHRKQAKNGIDPIKARQPEREETPTFTACAASYIRAHRRAWMNAKHARQWVRTLRTYAQPEVGSKTVDAITTGDILKIRVFRRICG